MYNTTREDASFILGVSVRSIDRYIKSGKLRAKKDGKNVLINDDDVAIISLKGNSNNQEVITPKNSFETKQLAKSNEVLDNIYNDLKAEIEKKDDIISDLSFKLGKMEEIAKQSITITEHKQSQFLLEESKQAVESELENKYKENIVLQKRFKEEKYANLILIIIALVLFVMLAFVWYSKI